ncbi:unnamed protein product [Dicrocoelium dendriticum]|nr:unnamed protein product [Dicrocoelium dendriticum]
MCVILKYLATLSVSGNIPVWEKNDSYVCGASSLCDKLALTSPRTLTGKVRAGYLSRLVIERQSLLLKAVFAAFTFCV